MQKLFFLLFFLIGVSFSFFEIRAKEYDYLICIDPGHGGMDGGTIYDDLVEKNINLVISLKLKKILELSGFKVILTRDSDISLSGEKFIKKEDLNKRIKIINNSNANLFVSIHVNSFPQRKYYGAQTFFHTSNPHNELIASLIQESLIKYTDTNRMIKPLDSIYLLKYVSIPGCLVECGFISNYKEYILLQKDEYLDLLCKSITLAIIEYLEFC